MNKCIHCGKEFDVAHARRVLGKQFGAGTYNDYCPEANVCEDCVWENVASDYQAGADVIELIGPGNAPWE